MLRNIVIDLKAAIPSSNGPEGEIWTTLTSIISDRKRDFGILMAANLSSPYTVRFSDTGFPERVSVMEILKLSRIDIDSRLKSMNTKCHMFILTLLVFLSHLIVGIRKKLIFYFSVNYRYFLHSSIHLLHFHLDLQRSGNSSMTIILWFLQIAHRKITVYFSSVLVKPACKFNIWLIRITWLTALLSRQFLPYWTGFD